MKKKIEKVYTQPVYKGFTLAQVCPRKGALELLKNPSRFGNKLIEAKNV